MKGVFRYIESCTVRMIHVHGCTGSYTASCNPTTFAISTRCDFLFNREPVSLFYSQLYYIFHRRIFLVIILIKNVSRSLYETIVFETKTLNTNTFIQTVGEQIFRSNIPTNRKLLPSDLTLIFCYHLWQLLHAYTV